MADLRSTMQDFPLTLVALLRHARDVHPDSPVLTCRDGTGRVRVGRRRRRARAAVIGMPEPWWDEWTGVGKLDERGPRARAGALAVVEVGRGPGASPEPSPALPAGTTRP